MIPKLFHYVWLGPTPMPEAYRAWMDRAVEMHPGWQLRLWDRIDGLDLAEYAEKCDTYSGQSDIVRFEVLCKYGGVYLDTDMLLLKNIEPLLSSSLVLCPSSGRKDLMATGFIACEPQNTHMRGVCDAVPSIDFSRNAFCGNQTGPGFFRRSLGDLSDAKVLPIETFYPIPFAKRLQTQELLEQIESNTPEGVYGVHAWNNSWGRADGRV